MNDECYARVTGYLAARLLGGVAQRDLLAVRLDAEEREGQRHREHRRSEKQEGREHRVSGRLGRDFVLAAGEDREREWPQDLADAVRGLAKPRRARAEADAILLDRVGREVREAAFGEKGGRGGQDDKDREAADQHGAVIAGES